MKDVCMWQVELAKVEQLAQTQEALDDQLMKLHVIANKFGLYDAADLIETLLNRNEPFIN